MHDLEHSRNFPVKIILTKNSKSIINVNLIFRNVKIYRRERSYSGCIMFPFSNK